MFETEEISTVPAIISEEIQEVEAEEIIHEPFDEVEERLIIIDKSYFDKSNSSSNNFSSNDQNEKSEFETESESNINTKPGTDDSPGEFFSSAPEEYLIEEKESQRFVVKTKKRFN